MVSRTSPSRRGIAAFASTIVVALALGAFGSSAFAAELPPENWSPPEVTPATPQVGFNATTSNGFWNEDPQRLPESFAYSWYRCDAVGGECSVIAGQSASKYLVAMADVGHTLVSQVIATNKYGSSPPVKSKATSLISLPAKYWYTCKFVKSGGSYTNSACTEAGKGAYISQKLEVPKAVTMSNTSPFFFQWNIGGLGTPDEIVSCSSQTSSGGTVSNPAGGATGTASVKLSFSGCSVVQPEGQKCTPTVSSPNYVGTVAGVGAYGGVKFEPEFWNGLSVTLSGSSCPLALKQEWTFQGSFTGAYNKAGLLEFTKANNAELVRAHTASITGVSKLQDTEGNLMKVGV